MYLTSKNVLLLSACRYAPTESLSKKSDIFSAYIYLEAELKIDFFYGHRGERQVRFIYTAVCSPNIMVIETSP